jgi:NAD(P)-dependent dehydrogenase (short-subunit alcohol dehydrogenase family)
MPYTHPDISGQYFISPLYHDTYDFIDPKKQDLSGKYVFITGASKGIGRATAIAYTLAGAAGIGIGARSNLKSLEEEILQTAEKSGKPKPKVLTLNLDVTDWKSVKDAAKKMESEFGRVDILINNAGYLSSFTKMCDEDPAEWWRTWEVNVKGKLLVE